MFTLENVLNIEGWTALALAVLSPTYMTPEQACSALSEGRHKRNSWDEVVPDILALRASGLSWKEVSEAMGYSVSTAMSMATRWRKRQQDDTTVAKKRRKAQKNQLTDQDVEDMVRMKESMTYKEIGQVYGVSGDTVYTRIRRFKKII